MLLKARSVRRQCKLKSNQKISKWQHSGIKIHDLVMCLYLCWRFRKNSWTCTTRVIFPPLSVIAGQGHLAETWLYWSKLHQFVKVTKYSDLRFKPYPDSISDNDFHFRFSTWKKKKLVNMVLVIKSTFVLACQNALNSTEYTITYKSYL